MISVTEFELGILPSGHLHFQQADQNVEPTGNSSMARIGKAFARNTGDGLFNLAILKDATNLPLSMLYWRKFAHKYLTKKCLLTPSNQTRNESIEPLAEDELKAILLSAPPMPGAEYLTIATLAKTWMELDDWLCNQAEKSGGLGRFLVKKAAQWHQVGRVCFHLAENKIDPDYPFAFMATYIPELTQQGSPRGRECHLPLKRALQEYTGAGNKKALINLLSPVHLAAKKSSMLAEFIEDGDIYHPLAWTPDQAYAFLQDIPIFEHSGIMVRIPDWWKRRNRPRVGISIGNVKSGNFGLDSLLDFKIQIALGEQNLSEGELNKILDSDDKLVYIKGQWIEVDKQKLSEALTHWKKVKSDTNFGLPFAEAMRLLAGAPADLDSAVSIERDREWSFAKPGKWLASLLEEIRSPDKIRHAAPAKTLKATLRPYQQTGVNWLWLLSQMGLGACLADDMGLGKTIQIIALLLKLKQKRDTKASLLVLPASLLSNWHNELQRFAPSLRCLYLHSSLLNKKAMDELGDKVDALASIDIVLTTYGMVMRQNWIQTHPWQLLVLDEAQAIKNPAARQTKIIKKLDATSRIALTGTPVENRLADLWSIFDFLNPGLLGSATRFKSFIKTLAAREDDQFAPLRQLVRPYILRRLKTDRAIISDLPDKTEVKAYCGLTKTQATQYEQAVRALERALESQDGMKRRGLVLSYLLRFKQICNHPSHLSGDGEYEPNKSGKFIRLAELCEEIASRQEKLLVFTQFREMTAPLAAFLTTQFSQPGLVLHGGTPVKQRQKRVEQFQQEAGPPFFVLSLKAGGTGLNLTQAAHVIHFDRWWNPAVENQATDRAFRIGQKNKVLVHKFVCSGTVEEKIDTLISEKISLANDLLESGTESFITEMDNQELINLVTLDVNKTRVAV